MIEGTVQTWAKRLQRIVRCFIRYVVTDLGTTLFCTVTLTKDHKIASLQLSSE
jgi:hypothetical protein